MADRQLDNLIGKLIFTMIQGASILAQINELIRGSGSTTAPMEERVNGIARGHRMYIIEQGVKTCQMKM
jgi:hypothetical protein